MRTASRRLLVIPALMVVILAGACQRAPQPQPQPTPEPGPHYQPIGRDWCERIGFAEIYSRFGLSEASDPSGNYHDLGDSWEVHCILRADGVNDDFATHRQRFHLMGSANFAVYSDPAEAERQQHLVAWSYEDDAPNVIVAPAHRWWEAGTYGQYTKDLGTFDRPDQPPIQALYVRYAIYDRNFLVQLLLVAQTYEGAIPRLRNVLHELAGAMLDGAADQLVLTPE